MRLSVLWVCLAMIFLVVTQVMGSTDITLGQRVIAWFDTQGESDVYTDTPFGGGLAYVPEFNDGLNQVDVPWMFRAEYNSDFTTLGGAYRVWEQGTFSIYTGGHAVVRGLAEKATFGAVGDVCFWFTAAGKKLEFRAGAGWVPDPERANPDPELMRDKPIMIMVTLGGRL